MIQWLQGTRKKVQQLTLEVAATTRQAVWERTESRIHEMTRAEARGYARARARLLVGRSTDSILTDRGWTLSASTRDRVVVEALESVVEWIVTRRRQLAPAVAPLRRAA